ncbi:MAG: bifunctional phosphoglucose/phosphomannose isomerase [Chloroflexi bacterium]|nr:bifunctional phosphoglucose/phosphomannose isomerase [Chloroflexota bacterium]
MNNPYDDQQHLRAVDAGDMLSHIDAFADQLQNAWDLSQTLPLPDSHRTPRQIVLCGMGGSAIGGDLAAALISTSSPVPWSVVRGYDIPAYVSGPETLVLASSFSGNTEETLAATEGALHNGTRLLALTTGGKLADHAAAHGYPLWQFDYVSQPRAALGWSFGLLVGLAHRLELAPNLDRDLADAITLLREHQAQYAWDVPFDENPAKGGASRLVGRLPVVLGSGMFEVIARRWKGQLNENAKTWAGFEGMPEANHNMVVSVGFPAAHDISLSALFITSPQYDHPRVQLRHQLTCDMCQENNILAEIFRPAGDSALAQMLHAIQYGDYVSFYLALAYHADPTTIEPIVRLKDKLAQHP